MRGKTETPFYRRIISDAWRIAWNHKHLWVFGFFAAAVGFGGTFEILFSGSGRFSGFFPAVASGRPTLENVPGLVTFKTLVAFSSFPAIFLLICMAILAFLFSVFAWIIYVSVGALVVSARKIEKGGEPTFGDSLKAGADKFWRVLGANVLAELFIFCGYVLTSTTLLVFLRDRTLASGVFYLGTFILFTLLTVATTIAAIYATCLIMLKDKKMMEAVGGGWKLLLEQWLVSLEMAVALFVTSLVIGLTLILAGLIVSVPFVFMLVVAALLRFGAASVLVLVVGATLLLVMIVLAGSFITVFQASAWTLLFGEMTEKRPLAKLRRLARKLSPYLD